MNRLTMRLAALGTAFLLVSASAPAMADDGEVDTPAQLQLSESSGVLTLPAGDGVRDRVSFMVTADSATKATLEVIGADDTTVLATLAPLTLTAGALSEPVEVDVAGLPAGLLSLRATPMGGESVTSALHVGSGRPAAVALSLASKTIYTWSGSSARSTVATVSAVDETDLAVPFSGSVTAKVGSASQTIAVTSSRGDAAKATISGPKLRAGAGTVTATATGNGGTAVSDAVALDVRATAVTSTKISRSESVIYPAKDGYKDTVKLSLTTKTTMGSTTPATGTVKIVNAKGKTVASWKLATTKKWSRTWNGKVGSKVAYGTYTVKVAVRGPEGATKTASTKVTVKKGKLVSRSLKTTVAADTVLTSYVDLGEWTTGTCYEDYFTAGDIFCDGYDSLDGISVLSAGVRSVPAVVRKAQKYGGAKVRMTAKVSSLYGQAAWGYAGTGATTSKTRAITSTGKNAPGWLGLPASTKTLDVFLGLGEYSFVGIDTFTIEYRYKTLSTT